MHRTLRPAPPAALATLLLVLAACAPETDAPAPPAAPPPAEAPGPDSLASDSLTAEDEPAAPSEWTAGIVDVTREGGMAVLREVREGTHEGFVRVVFEFAERVPGYHLEYVDEPVRQCGSGEPVPIAGDAWLEVQFQPAAAHTEAGEPTVAARDRALDRPPLRQLTLTCDFEGDVTWVLGLAAPNRYRVAALADPPRLVVDVQR